MMRLVISMMFSKSMDVLQGDSRFSQYASPCSFRKSMRLSARSSRKPLGTMTTQVVDDRLCQAPVFSRNSPAGEAFLISDLPAAAESASKTVDC
jgi:hypothetical protein